MKWFKREKRADLIQPELPPQRIGFFSTDFTMPKVGASEMDNKRRAVQAMAASFQKWIGDFQAIDANNQIVDNVTTGMDEAYEDLTQAKIINSRTGFLPLQQLEWYGQQGFIGWQTCAILSQNWLIDKACGMPGQDAIRHGWDVTFNDGLEVDEKLAARIRRGDKKYAVKRQLRQYIKMGRIFGIRHAMYLIDGIDYELPFNPDGVKPGSYRGITQVDPYWIAPILDARAASNPAAKDFYEPTWWLINGQRVHRSHLSIMHNGDEVPDLLKPSYYYGGIPIPQKIFERVYAAERTANEAPMLAMTKRLTVLKADLTKAIANPQEFAQKMEYWLSIQNNFGAKIIGGDEEIDQFDTSLSELDSTIMTQYQLVAAASNVPATKLLGTQPKGFNATGDYEESTYHEELESIQEHDLTPFLDGHYIRMLRSDFPEFKDVSSYTVEVAWKPTDSPTAEELATLNKTKADTDKTLVEAGSIDGFDVRQRLIKDPDSGYTGIEDVVPSGPGDREHEQEVAETLLEASSTPQESKEQKSMQVKE